MCSFQHELEKMWTNIIRKRPRDSDLVALFILYLLIFLFFYLFLRLHFLSSSLPKVINFFYARQIHLASRVPATIIYTYTPFALFKLYGLTSTNLRVDICQEKLNKKKNYKKKQNTQIYIHILLIKIITFLYINNSYKINYE